MTDEEIVELHNECLREQARRAAEYQFAAIEVPLGSAQIRHEPRARQWVPRGDVLRCVVHDDENGELLVEIDDHELTLAEFGRLLVTHAGWGMRIEFTPEDDVHHRPVLQVREPDPQ